MNAIHYNNATPEQRRYIEERIRSCVYCQTGLIDALTRHDISSGPIAGFSAEDIQNMEYPACPECGEKMDETTEQWCGNCCKLISDEPDPDEEHCRCDEDNRDMSDDDAFHCPNCGHVCTDPESEYYEAYEWWLITDSWVFARLREMGEVVIDNDYGTWWGRTCTGQSIVLDPAFWEIYQDRVREI